MKKYILYILVGIASWGLASCNGFLDVDQYFNDLYQLDSVFTKQVRQNNGCGKCIPVWMLIGRSAIK